LLFRVELVNSGPVSWTCKLGTMFVKIQNSNKSNLVVKHRRAADPQLNQNFFSGSNAVNINCGLEGCPEFLFNFAKLSNAVIKQVLIYTSLLYIDFKHA